MTPLADDGVIVTELVRYLEAAVVGNPRFVRTVDHRSALASDARVIAGGVRPPVGALILYATWLEHWANGLLILFGPRKGLSASRIKNLMTRPLRERLRLAPDAVGMQPLSVDLTEGLTRLIKVRNDFLHFKWSSATRHVGSEGEGQIHSLVSGAEDWIPQVERHTKNQLYEPALSIAERLFGVDRDDLALGFA
jgi:hypothetical protein